MAGYIGSKAVSLSTTAADVTGDAEIGGDLTVDTNTLYVDSTNNRVGVGTSSPADTLHVRGSGGNGYIRLDNSSGGERIYLGSEAGISAIYAQTSAGGNLPLKFATGSTERMRIDSGNLLVGKTSASYTIAGAQVEANGVIGATVNNNQPMFANRLSSDGSIFGFYKDGSTVGSIGVFANDEFYIEGGSGIAGFGFLTGRIIPRKGSTGYVDNEIDLGQSNVRFDDIYATNGTIQTSDRNEKQQIASLTDAEMTAAKAISKLFKTFKWNDSVAKKGDAARTHSGVIAQDVEQAMTDAGLNAGDYAFFISSTWWETQTEVPAVEAVEAQDAVYEDVIIPAVEEVLDEEGNVVTEAQPERTEQRLVAEAVEAVEAQEAYTRTDTYDTLEEAPEGATERNRKGIRYPQLLSFIGAATEQRLASIETRLDALEANE